MIADPRFEPPWCVFPSFADLDWLLAGVTTRASETPYLDGQGRAARDHIRAVASAHQVHGSRVVNVTGAREASPKSAPGHDAGSSSPVATWRYPDADGLMTSLEGVLIKVSVADCVPAIVVDPRRRVIGVAHAGWRGLAAGVLTELFRAMEEAWGTRPSDCRAGLGPAIGPCCYTVGPDVAEAMATHRRDAAFVEPAGADGMKQRLDLWKTGEIELRGLGVPASSIDSLRMCTSCHPELFFSRRRDGAILGRMWGFAAIVR